MQELLKTIPKIDILLEDTEIKLKIETSGRWAVINALREATGKVRAEILSGVVTDKESILPLVFEYINTNLSKESPTLRRVLNGTGTVLHTNLGRSILSAKAQEELRKISVGYSNLELDLDSGQRGSRYTPLVPLLKELTGCEDALIVNNNAAAVLLVFNTLAANKEAIVSRGELVEIGGSFRIPAVMSLGNVNLTEVGTTNKTHLSDYADALTENTGMIAKIHTSNYVLKGFTASVSVEELSTLSRSHNVPLYCDLGSGSLIDLKAYNGNINEPTIPFLIKNNVDLVSFSGDKLLGGPQCGIIVGKKSYIELLKKNQLLRTLRVDKFTLAALYGTLLDYRNPEEVLKTNKTLAMLSITKDELLAKAEDLLKLLEEALPALSVEIIETTSLAGGGSLPEVEFPSYALTFPELNAQEAYDQLRQGTPALIGRIFKNRFILDVRTLDPSEYPTVISSLSQLSGGSK